MEPQLVFLSSLKNSKSNKKGLMFMKRFFALMLVTLLITSVLMLTSCVWGPTIAYEWQVESHSEFVEEIEKFNSTNDEYISTFISFDLDENENISKQIYHFNTIANKSAVNKYGLCDKICSTFDIDIMYYIRSNIENAEYQDYAYLVGCYYRDVSFNFSAQDNIEIKRCNTYEGEYSDRQCSHAYEDQKYFGSIDSDTFIYNHTYHYEIFVNDTEVACIHISSIDETSEEKLNEIINMLYDSLVVLNTEKVFIWRDKE